ncbi:MAG: hypothetical protein ABIH34_02680, partial [Nanoarchaeota archaeon]
MAQKKESKHFIFRAIIGSVFGIAIIVGLLLWLAGRTDYWQAWLFGGVMILYSIVKGIIFRDKEDLAKERLRPGPGTKWWDKIYYGFMIPLSFGTIFVAVLDTGRYGWSAEAPIWFYILSYILFIV